MKIVWIYHGCDTCWNGGNAHCLRMSGPPECPWYVYDDYFVPEAVKRGVFP